MPDNQHSFVIPENQSISALVSKLQAAFPVQVQAESVYHRVFYDTFDWRLHKNGSALEVHDDGRSNRIYWRADKDGKLKIQLGLKKIPRLAADLPACEFRQQLQSVITVRELLPRIKLRIKRQSLAVLDENKKIVVRLNFDVYWYSPTKRQAARVLTQRLTIKPVKGYAEAHQRVEDFFLNLPLAMPLQPAQDNVMKLALTATGVRTDEYTTRLYLRLDPETPAEQVFQGILLQLLEIKRKNTAGCVKGRDTVFMHDYRVAIRKICVALKQLNQLQPQAITTEYKDFFSKLHVLSDPVRELDILLYQLANYQADFDTSGWQHLQALRDYLLLSRAEAQKEFVEEAKSSHYRKTIKQLRDYLADPDTENLSPDKPGKAVYKLSDELLWDNNKKALKHRKAITKISDADSLHELRKIFNNMRYLMEFFRGIYPAGKKQRELIQLLIDVQDDLEKFTDVHIQIARVNAFIEQHKNEDAIEASEQIIKILQLQHDKAGQRFKDSYAAYASSTSQVRFKEMFVDYYGRKN